MKSKITNIDILKRSIQKLISSRIRPFYWVDEEQELEQETLAYKAIQSLSTLFYANKQLPQILGKFKLNGEFIYEELLEFYKIYNKEGFYPSPYSYVREIRDYIDFASDTLGLFTEIFTKSEKKSLKLIKKDHDKLTEMIFEIINASVKLLEDSVYVDKDGARWEAIYDRDRKKPLNPNVYFTSVAIKNLNKIINSKFDLSISKKEKYSELIKQGAEWILNRQKDGLITGDEKKTKTEINHSIYALSSLVEVWEKLNDEHQDKTKELFSFLCQYIPEHINELQYQDFMPLYLPQTKKDAYYDDRLTNAQILSVLVKSKTLFSDVAIDSKKFINFTNEFSRKIIDNFNFQNNCWTNETFYISDTCDSIVALLDYDRFGTPPDYNLTEFEILEVLNKTLKRSEIRSVFLSELTKLESKKFAEEFKALGKKK